MQPAILGFVGKVAYQRKPSQPSSYNDSEKETEKETERDRMKEEDNFPLQNKKARIHLTKQALSWNLNSHAQWTYLSLHLTRFDGHFFIVNKKFKTKIMREEK